MLLALRRSGRHRPGRRGLLPRCGRWAASSPTATGRRRRVVASFYPLAWVTEQVAGDGVEGHQPHRAGRRAARPRPDIRQTAELAEADLVVYLEHGFQPAVDDAVETNAGGAVLDAADVVDLPDLRARPRPARTRHDHGDLDPHFWLDPLRMADLADAVADQLAELDPEAHAGRATATAPPTCRPELEASTGVRRRASTACERDAVVVSHDAFGYLASYGLHFEPIAGPLPRRRADPADLAGLPS